MNKQPANQREGDLPAGRERASAEGTGWGRDLTAEASFQQTLGRDQAVARHWTEGDKAVAPDPRGARSLVRAVGVAQLFLEVATGIAAFY